MFYAFAHRSSDWVETLYRCCCYLCEGFWDNIINVHSIGWGWIFAYYYFFFFYLFNLIMTSLGDLQITNFQTIFVSNGIRKSLKINYFSNFYSCDFYIFNKDLTRFGYWLLPKHQREFLNKRNSKICMNFYWTLVKYMQINWW